MGSHDQCHFHHMYMYKYVDYVCWMMRTASELHDIVDIVGHVLPPPPPPPPQLVILGTIRDLENSQSVHIIIQYEKFCNQKLRIMNVLVMDCGQDPDANTVWIVD